MKKGRHTLSGFHAVDEYLKSGRPAEALLAAAANRRVTALCERAEKLGIPVRRVSREELANQAGPKTRDVALVVPESEASRSKRSTDLRAADRASGRVEGRAENHTGDRLRSLGELYDSVEQRLDALILLLDGITDPQNLGAILRSAEQFGVDAVLLPKRRSAGLDSRVVRASAGAAAHLLVIEGVNLAEAVAALQSRGVWVYAADAQGIAAPQLRLEGKVALVMGSEGSGVRRLVRDRCDGLISIPTRGQLDSLNVSVATGILLYEIRRRTGG